MSGRSIFYCWTSESPEFTRRIRKSLQGACKALTIDFDEATRGLPGSPDIVESILDKLNNADVVVADLSMATGGPNHNVVYELGYADNVLGNERIIIVMDEEAGKPEDLPFDLLRRFGGRRISIIKDSMTDQDLCKE